MTWHHYHFWGGDSLVSVCLMQYLSMLKMYSLFRYSNLIGGPIFYLETLLRHLFWNAREQLPMDRHFFRVGGAPVRAFIELDLGSEHIGAYQVDTGKWNPNKEPEYPEEKLNLRDENQDTWVWATVTEKGVILSTAYLWPWDCLPNYLLRAMPRMS